jgi:endonuclease YncB( thermonuclease family)
MIRVLYLFTVAYFIALPSYADSFVGMVIGVSDGDTITVLDSGKQQHKIRLAGIDAPEKGQAFGERAKQHLSLLLYRHDVFIDWNKRDKYRRIVGQVWVAPTDTQCADQNCPQTLDVSLAQLSAGLAWHYKKYENEQLPIDRSRYAEAEGKAHSMRLGLWADQNPLPPWEWRALAKASKNGNLDTKREAQLLDQERLPQ